MQKQFTIVCFVLLLIMGKVYGQSAATSTFVGPEKRGFGDCWWGRDGAGNMEPFRGISGWTG